MAFLDHVVIVARFDSISGFILPENLKLLGLMNLFHIGYISVNDHLFYHAVFIPCDLNVLSTTD